MTAPQDHWGQRVTGRGIAVIVLMIAGVAYLTSERDSPSSVSNATESPSASIEALIATDAPETPSVPPTVRPIQAPTAPPKPTLKPAVLSFGKLEYTVAGCWRSDYKDAAGHTISGTRVDFKITAKNAGEVKSDLIPIRIETTDWFDTEPLLFEASWKDVRFSNGSKHIQIEGPAVLPGKSRPMSWSVLFQAPFDVHYVVDAAGHEWDIWTSTEVCF